MRFGDEYQVFRSELQIALNSNDNYDYVYDFAHPKKISTWGAATSENPSASLTGKPALRPMRDFSNNRVVQKNNGVNAKQVYRKIEENVPHVKRFSLNVPVQQTKYLIAVHNLDEEKLLADINELGGFPAPSIAIIRQGRHMMMPNISGSIQTTKQIKI